MVVLEAEATPGGGARTVDLGLASGLRHDLCSAVHPLAWASPFFAEFDLPARGVRLLTPEVSFAHPLPGGRAAVAFHDLHRTVAGLGSSGRAWEAAFAPLVDQWPLLVRTLLGDMRHLGGPLTPQAVSTLAQFGAAAAREAGPWAGLHDEAAALFAGVAAHSMARLPSLPAAAAGLMLATLAHAPGGWPIPHGGSASIIAALIADLEAHGGTLQTLTRIEVRRDLPPADGYVFDTTPSHVARIFADQLNPRGRHRLLAFRHGPGVAKVDFVLSGPVPWTNPDVARAGTVHLGGPPWQVAAAEAQISQGHHADRPVCLVSDPSITDPTRQVDGLRPLWAYAHVPPGSPRDVTPEVVAQIARFAPGFQDVVVASRASRPTRWPTTTRTTSAATSPAERSPCARWPPDRPGPGTPIPCLAPRGCTCAPPRRRRARACTAWAAWAPRAACCATSCTNRCPPSPPTDPAPPGEGPGTPRQSRPARQ